MRLTVLILAFYFLLGSILPGSDFSQLKKAPAVWKHYQLHQQLAAESGQDVSLFDFLYAHFLYPDSHQHDDDGQSHQELPLKSIHIFSQILLSNTITITSAPLVAACYQLIPHHHSFSGATHDGAIFRPPILS